MVNQLGEHLPELHEEAFARHILIRKHMEFHLIKSSDIRQQLLILGFEERGRRDGYRLMSGRKHRPAIATSLRNEQPLARFQSLHNRQIIDAASCAVGEPEAGSILLLFFARPFSSEETFPSEKQPPDEDFSFCNPGSGSGFL